MRIVAALAVAGLVLSCTAHAADRDRTPKKELKTQQEKLAYTLGMDVGRSLKGLDAEVDFAAFVQGVEDALDGRDAKLSEEEAEQVKQAFMQRMREQHARKVDALAEKNKKEGQAFLEKNKKEKGVVVTASGLQYTVLRDGAGPSPKAEDRVRVHYRGTLIDGTEFDSSYKRQQPITFPVKGVIGGWTEALQLMKVGGKYKLFIPSELAYRDAGAGQHIGPNATLIFEVELLAIEQ